MKNQATYFIWKCASIMLCMTLACWPVHTSAQDKPEDEELSVALYLPALGSTEIPAIIRGNNIYLSVGEFFDFLKISHTLSSGKDTLSGFLLHPQDTYLIDAVHLSVSYQRKQTQLTAEDLLHTVTGYYMKSDYFGKIFGLNCLFNFRSLSVNLDTRLDLPVIRELRQDKMRSNINHIRGILKVDTTIARSYTGFKMGMADWSVTSSQQQQSINYTGLSLSLGAALAGGETDVSLNYNNNQPFTLRNQLYLWRFVNNDNAVLRQIIAGKIASRSIASIYGPVTGVQLTNTPSVNRTAFGTYKLSDITEPGWKVELYVNNELVDYQQADASGFFSFDVPIVYGNTQVDLHFYGPWGEERSQRRNVNVPFNFLPKAEFEYTLYAGLVEDGIGSQYMQANFNYGLTRQITMGGGMEYLSSISSQKVIPFLNTSLRLASNLLLYGEYAYGVQTRGILNYRLPSDLTIELDYTLYHKGQQAVLFNYKEERKAILNFPIRSKNLNLFSRFTIDQVFLPVSSSINMELLLSGIIAGINTNLTTYSKLSRANTPQTYSILSQTYNLPERLLFTPQVQYDYPARKCTSAKFDLERSIFNCGYIKLSLERNFLINSYNTGISLRYDFSFARTAATASRNSKSGLSFTQTASGSLLYDKNTQELKAGNISNVGKAAFTVLAYLDLNGNGRKDAAEPKVAGLSLRIRGGVMKYSERDTLIRITNLEPYRNYVLEVNPGGFDNIAWQIKKPNISVTAEPNQFKQIEIPVTIAAEISGMVYLKSGKEQRGLARIKVNIYNSQFKRIAQVLSESDGYFSYLGLAPGSYTIGIDAIQLKDLQITTLPVNIPVSISQRQEGDVVDGLEFILLK